MVIERPDSAGHGGARAYSTVMPGRRRELYSQLYRSLASVCGGHRTRYGLRTAGHGKAVRVGTKMNAHTHHHQHKETPLRVRHHASRAQTASTRACASITYAAVGRHQPTTSQLRATLCHSHSSVRMRCLTKRPRNRPAVDLLHYCSIGTHSTQPLHGIPRPASAAPSDSRGHSRPTPIPPPSSPPSSAPSFCRFSPTWVGFGLRVRVTG